MRNGLFGLAVAALLLSGCATDPQGPATPPTPSPAWKLDCTLGTNATPQPWHQACLTRASKTAGAKAEMWLAINPKDPDNVVIGTKDLDPELSKGCVWNGLSITHDGGTTWKGGAIGGKYASRQPTEPWYGFACNTDPMMAFNHDGSLHYVVEMYNLGGQDAGGVAGFQPGWKLLLATSHDGGETWPDIVTIDVADGFVAVNDYSRITISPTTHTVLTAINTFGAASTYCRVIVSRDMGKTAELPVLIASTEPASGTGCFGAAAAPDGTFVIGGLSSPGLSDGSRITTDWSRSTDDAATFSRPAPGFSYQALPLNFPEDRYRTGTNFEVTMDLTDGPGRGTLWCIYAAREGSDADVFVRKSLDLGATWMDAVRVNNETPNNQWMPNLVVAGDGSLHAFFLDKRWDPENTLVDVTHAWSVDGGLNWTNERVTSKSWDGALGKHQNGFPFIGDYLGIGSVGNVVWGAFPDASDGVVTSVAAARIVLT